MELVYFARIRENIGRSTESLSLPENVTDVQGVIDYLRQQGDQYQVAFENEALIRVAINQAYVTVDHPVQDSDEVAFFPPMTGG